MLPTDVCHLGLEGGELGEVAAVVQELVPHVLGEALTLVDGDGVDVGDNQQLRE